MQADIFVAMFVAAVRGREVRSTARERNRGEAICTT
jgi:hypothetical protein